MVRNLNNLVKESLPFICIVNPPRHGKTLFLDRIRIYFDEKDMRVVEMTYSNNSNIIEREKPYLQDILCTIFGYDLLASLTEMNFNH